MQGQSARVSADMQFAGKALYRTTAFQFSVVTRDHEGQGLLIAIRLALVLAFNQPPETDARKHNKTDNAEIVQHEMPNHPTISLCWMVGDAGIERATPP
eukprot:gene16356-21679_t